jgi:HK97 family phage major capsid protein
MISRTDAEALIPEEVSREIIQGTAESSAVMRLARRLPDMARSKRRMPVLSVLPTAYFVNGDTGLKQTTEMKWESKYIEAEELAVIVPIPEAVLDDADYDIWGEVKPWTVNALGIAFDQAVIYGVNAPASWPTDVLAAATAAGNTVTIGTVGNDIYDDLMEEGGVINLVEMDGYMVSGHVADLSMRAKLRGLRADDGQPIFVRSMQDSTRYELDGEPIEFPRNGAVDATKSLMISGAFDELVFAMRKDVTYKLLTEAVIQNAAGEIVYNLAQQDMVALRVVMRLGWQVPNPINRIQETESQRYPFAVLEPST